MRILVALAFFLLPEYLNAANQHYFLRRNCELPFDPSAEQEKLDNSTFSCVRGSATVDSIFIPHKTFGLSSELDLHSSYHIGSQHALFLEYYFEQLDSPINGELSYRTNQEIQTLAYQYGNPALSYFRAIIGQQTPVFGINQFPSLPFAQILNPRYVWGLSEPGLTISYDTQKQGQLDLQWSTDESFDPKHIKIHNHRISARHTYDFSILNGTRTEISYLTKKSGEKRFGIGLISNGPANNRFHVEFVRIYASLSESLASTVKGTLASSTQGINSPYQQIIRIAYEDFPDRKVQNSILFDDLAFQYRLFAIGTTYNFEQHTTYVRMILGFKQDTTGRKRHRWIFGLGFGGRL